MQHLRMVYVNAAEMDAQVEFYTNLLEQQPAFRDGDKWTEFRLPQGGRFALSGPDESASQVKGAVVVFETTRMDALATALRSQGRDVSIRDMGTHGRVLTTADPEGTTIQIFARATDAHSTDHRKEPHHDDN